MQHPLGININFILNDQGNKKYNILMASETKLTGYTHVALDVEEMTKTKEALTILEIKLSDSPRSHPTGRSMFIRDPDDNVIEFITPKKP